MIKVSYSQREGDDERLVFFTEKNVSSTRINEIIRDYPWKSELEWFEKTREGGGFDFVLGDYENSYAYYQFVPVEIAKGFLTLDIVLNKGFLGIFGRKAKSIDFETVSMTEAIAKIQELTLYSISDLYYQK